VIAQMKAKELIKEKEYNSMKFETESLRAQVRSG
jgi:hypothetical protein